MSPKRLSRRFSQPDVRTDGAAMKPLMAPLRLRSIGGDGHRKVTWLELFFDLIFVAAVSQVAEPLRGDYAIAGLVRFAPLFGLI